MEGSIKSNAMFEIRWPGFYVQPLKVRSKTNKVRKNILQEVPVEKDANVKQDIPEAQAEDSKKMLLIRDSVPPKGMVPSDEEENRSVALNHDCGAFAGSPTLPLPQFLMLDVKMTTSCDRSAT